jgi:hypothetical protein
MDGLDRHRNIGGTVMTRSRAPLVVLLLLLAAPIGLGGLALPAYAQENDDSQSYDAGDQTVTENPAEATNDANVACGEGNPCSKAGANPQPVHDFSKLDGGGPPAGQTLQIYGSVR